MSRLLASTSLTLISCCLTMTAAICASNTPTALSSAVMARARGLSPVTSEFEESCHRYNYMHYVCPNGNDMSECFQCENGTSTTKYLDQAKEGHPKNKELDFTGRFDCGKKLSVVCMGINDCQNLVETEADCDDPFLTKDQAD